MFLEILILLSLKSFHNIECYVKRILADRLIHMLMQTCKHATCKCNPNDENGKASSRRTLVKCGSYMLYRWIAEFIYMYIYCISSRSDVQLLKCGCFTIKQLVSGRRPMNLRTQYLAKLLYYDITHLLLLWTRFFFQSVQRPRCFAEKPN